MWSKIDRQLASRENALDAALALTFPSSKRPIELETRRKAKRRYRRQNG
jgi:hypothetical protein